MFLLLIAGPAFAGAATDQFLDYLYIEPNEGDSSGGHAALRFDRYTFHFLHEEPGIVRLRRYDSGAFDYAYAKLGNRPIHHSRIALAGDTHRFLEESFTRFLLIQDAQIEEREALRRDVNVIEALLAQAGEGAHAAALSLPAAGYFLSEAHATADGIGLPAGNDPALLDLREKVASRHGERFIETRLAALLREISETVPEGVAQVPRQLSLDTYPLPHLSSASRFYHAAYEVVGLSILQGALPLQPGTYWHPSEEAWSLTARERETLTAYAERLEDDLVRVVKSRRPDRALPLTVGMARLCAVRESLRTGHLVLLDFFPAEASAASAEGEPPYLGELERELREVFQSRRADFFAAGGAQEANYTSLERAGNLLLEVQRARKAHAALRKPPVPSLPARGARLVPFLPPGVQEAQLVHNLAAAREAERSYSRLLLSKYAYDLLGRNCVTELFTLLNGSMARLCEKDRGGTCTDEEVRQESERRLGGYVDGTRGLVFIPVVADAEVSTRYRVAARSETPSYRQEQIALMQEKEGPLKVFLRESNTLTSTLYRPGAEDSFFLFFTDNAGALRPLFGAFNVVAGVGETLYGVVTLPVKGPRHVLSGVKGILFSVPELFFVSLRKGSMGYVERDLDAAAEPAPKEVR